MEKDTRINRERIQDILGELSELDVAERLEMLDHASAGDEEFRAQMKRLLDNYDSALQFSRQFPHLLLTSSAQNSPLFSDGEIVASRFRICRLRGQGGIGEVYEAEDLELRDERVALKTLRASLAADERLVQQFEQELRLARRISHPNVCRVHDVFQHQTPAGARISLFTMELLEGETLANRLQRGRMATEEALPFVKQVAEAIDAAHAANVAHGDLKPGNIMLVPTSPGGERAVVTDFGLARWMPVGATLVPTTVASRPWGTPVYMAPEQLLGGHPTPASDIYALGVVCYEMVTGHQPFSVALPLLLAVRKLRQAQLRPRELVPDLEPRWQAAILRCLEVDPERRFRFAKDLVKALERKPLISRTRMATAAAVAVVGILAVSWAGTNLIETGRGSSTAVTRQVRSEQTVAVLPFAQENPTEEGDAFALGLTAVLTERLGSMSHGRGVLHVIPAAEVIDTGVNTPALAQQTLGATLFISARLAVLNDRTEIAIGLNELSDQGLRLKASRRLTLTSNDRDILGTVTAAAMELLEIEAVASTQPPSGDAHQLETERSYLLGRGYLAQGTRSLTAAIEAFRRSVGQSDQYAPAHSGLGEAYLAHYVASRDANSLRQAQVSIDRAIAIEPRDARSRVIRGRIYMTTSQYPRAILELTDALALDPDAPDARRRLGQGYERAGEIPKAEEVYREAVARHPRHWSGHEDLGVFLFRQGRYREAEESLVAASAYAPANLFAIRNLAAVYTVQERFEAAESELEKGRALSPDAPLLNNLAWVYILEGKFGDAVSVMEEAIKLSRADSLAWSSLARAYRWAGGRERDESTAYKMALQRADEEMRVDPSNAEKRGNRAYLLAEMGRTDAARREMRAALALDSAKANVIVLFDSALAHEWIGDRKRALEDLLLAARGGYSKTIIERHPDLRRLRNDPGYRRILDVAEERAAQRFNKGRSQ